jgi:hypothetical protein
VFLASGLQVKPCISSCTGTKNRCLGRGPLRNNRSPYWFSLCIATRSTNVTCDTVDSSAVQNSYVT